MSLVLALLAPVVPAVAQVDSGPPPFRPGYAAATAAGGVVYLAPHVFGLNEHAPSCAPCDRSAVPWYDRWAIGPPREALSTASSALLVGLAAAAWWDLAHQGTPSVLRLASSVVAASWAVGSTELLKAVVARKRPVLYTAGAAGVSGDLDNQRSLPSGHAAAAFALATSYWLEGSRHGLRGWRPWAAMAAAAGVGALRVAAAKHFPSDVVAGGALGAASALMVYKIHF